MFVYSIAQESDGESMVLMHNSGVRKFYKPTSVLTVKEYDKLISSIGLRVIVKELDGTVRDKDLILGKVTRDQNLVEISLYEEAELFGVEGQY
jgi:hypothetical protein